MATYDEAVENKTTQEVMVDYSCTSEATFRPAHQMEHITSAWLCGLNPSPLFELNRREILDPRVSSRLVVPDDLVKDCGPCLLSCAQGCAIDELSFA